VVYEALDRDRDAVVALKTLSRASPTAVSRFKREFRAMADLIHPNLVTLYELVAGPDELFFTMELVSGVHFHQWVRPSRDPTTVADPTAQEQTPSTLSRDSEPAPAFGPLDPMGRAPPVHRPRPTTFRLSDVDMPRLRSAMRQLAEGTFALHEAGLLHRDIKPSNIKVTDEGRLVLLDFGLVADLADERDATEDRPLMGTVGYMSPEQGARLPLTPASDWYSVGAVLYRSLTGRLPFVGGRDDVLMDQQRFEPAPPSELVEGVPADLDALCRDLLRRDRKRRPEGAEILRRLGSSVASRSVAVGASSSSLQTQDALFIGRQAEFEGLRAAFDEVVEQRRPGLVQLAGRSGVGKSRIARAFADEVAENRDAVVLRGRCYETESVPFKAVDALIDAVTEHLCALPAIQVEGLMPRDALALAQVFPVLRKVEAVTAARRRALVTPDPQELRRRAFEALADLLGRLADRRPLVLIIDDLQWGDIDSAALLASMFDAADPPALLLVACFRSEDERGNPFLDAFAHQLDAVGVEATRLRVEPLTPGECEELAMFHLAGTVPDAAEHAARIAVESFGSPLFVEELARHVRERGVGDEAVSLDSVLEGRLRRLPDAALELMFVLAAAGRPIGRELALRAAGIADLSVLSLLRAAGFLRGRISGGGGRTLEPYHDRVREVVLSIANEDDLISLHGRLVTVFESTVRPDPEVLTYHCLGAGYRDRAAQYAVEAAERAVETLAFDRAASLYATGIEHGPDGARTELLTARANALTNAGRGAEAADAFLAAAARSAGEEALDLRSRAAAQLMVSGHVERALSELRSIGGAIGMHVAATPLRALVSAALGRLRISVRGLHFRATREREIPASQLAQVDVGYAVTAGLGMADVIRSTDFQSRHLLLALRVGEPRRAVRALAGEAILRSYLGWPNRRGTARVASMLEELRGDIEDPGVHGIVEGALGLVAFNQGAFQVAHTRCAAAEETFRDRCVGHRWELATAQLFVGSAAALMGRVGAMVEQYPRMIKEAIDRGDLYAATMFRACFGFYVPLVTGNVDAAIAEVEQGMKQWTANGYHLQHLNALHSLARCDLYRGDAARALQRCDEQWRSLERSLLLRGQLMRVLLKSARGKSAITAYAAGRRDASLLRRARADIRSLERERVPGDVTYVAAITRGLRAALAHAVGDLDGAVEWLARTEESAASAHMALNEYCARYVRGKLVGGDEGAELVESAHAYFRSEGLVEPGRLVAVFAPDLDVGAG